MKYPFVLFWTVLVFASIAWYALLVVYVGLKAGREIRVLMNSLGDKQRPPPSKKPEAL